MREIRRILADVEGLRVLDLDEAHIPASPDEDHLEPFETFEENARSKARFFFEQSGIPTVADDSGIAVDALDGAPGVRSKRFAPRGLAGEAQDVANNRHLVDLLKGVPAAERTARYVCVAVFVDGSGRELLARGEAEGVVIDEPRGTGGFGYDPHILIPELGRTFAELSPEEKNARSHRGVASRRLVEQLRTDVGAGS